MPWMKNDFFNSSSVRAALLWSKIRIVPNTTVARYPQVPSAWRTGWSYQLRYQIDLKVHTPNGFWSTVDKARERADTTNPVRHCLWLSTNVACHLKQVNQCTGQNSFRTEMWWIGVWLVWRGPYQHRTTQKKGRQCKEQNTILSLNKPNRCTRKDLNESI